MKHSIDYPLASRPIMGFADEYPAGMLDPPHSHPRSQLTYCTAGVMLVVISDAVFMLPPRRAIWIPAGIEHEVRCRGPVSSHTLYIDPALDRSAPHGPRVIEVSDLVRALIMEVGGFEPRLRSRWARRRDRAAAAVGSPPDAGDAHGHADAARRAPAAGVPCA